MDIDEDLNFLLQSLIRDSAGKQSFVFDNAFTQKLQVGSSIKIVGFALGKYGITVTDTERIEVRSHPEYQLSFEKSYYILANDGLFMDIKKRQESCPNSQQTMKDLDANDWSRLSCALHTIDR